MRLLSTAAVATRDGRDGGFALVVVLLAIGLLALIATTFMFAVRAHLRSSSAISAAARAEALADGGVNIAVLDTMAVREDRTRTRRFPTDGATVACRAGDDARLLVSVQDEAGRVDLNSASEALLLALMRGIGLGESDAARMVDRILDYRDRDGDRRPLGAERAEYEAAGLPGPKNAPLDAVEELAQVVGADAAVIDRVRRSVTVNSGLAGVDPRVMPAQRVEMLTSGVTAAGTAFAGAARPVERGALPPRFVEISPQQVFLIRSSAETADGAMFVREAVIDLGPRRARAHTFKRWLRGASDRPEEPIAARPPITSLPPC